MSKCKYKAACFSSCAEIFMPRKYFVRLVDTARKMILLKQLGFLQLLLWNDRVIVAN